MATILIVDDRPANREYLVTLLGYGGHRLLEAADGEEALAVARAERPDLIIADIVMPTMDGYELARQVRADRAIAQTQIIFLTSSYVVAETQRLAQACGVAYIIAKPAEPQAVLDIVSAALQTRPVLPLLPVAEEFHREHMRVLTNTLAKKVEELEAEIVERKQAEGQIRYLATVLENVSDGIVSTDVNRDIQSWNLGAEAMFGYRAEEVVGRPYDEVLAYDFVEVSRPDAVQMVAETERWTGEVRVRRKDGTPIYVLVAGATLKDNAGVVTGISAVLHDITERKQAEAALTASEAELRALFAAMTDVVLVLDADGRHLQIAPTNPALLVRPPADLLGRTVHEVLPAADADRILATIRLALQVNEPVYLEYSLVIGGGQVWFDATISPMGQNRVFWISRDITERKLRERELEAFAAVSTALRTANTQSEMLPIILEQVTALLNAGAAALAMRDPITDELVIALGHGAMAGLAGQRLPAGAGIGGEVLATGRPYLTDDVVADPRFYQLNWPSQAQAVACVPLITSRHVLGVLWAARAAPFSEIEVRVLSAVADIAASAIQRAALHEQTKQQLRRLTALREIDSAIMSSLDLRMTLVIILGHVMDQLGVDASDILLLSRGMQVLEYAAGRGFRSKAIEQARQRLGDGHAGRAALERRLVSVPDLRSDSNPFRREALLAEEAFVALFCVPLLAKGQVVGVLEVFHRAPLNPDADWLGFLEALAGQVAIAVADAWLFADLQRLNMDMLVAYDTTLEGWSAALDLRDKETEGHSQRVTETTLLLARALGVAESELEHMRRGALLHDIGKMGVPDAILLKPGPLSDEEWAVMHQHPWLAYQLLSPIAYLRPALDIPYCHHEKWDGTGYPRHLKAEAIPLSARIFAVVDVWDALRSDRPYRLGWPDDKVRAYLLDQAGKHFDPKVVETFLALKPFG